MQPFARGEAEGAAADDDGLVDETLEMHLDAAFGGVPHRAVRKASQVEIAAELVGPGGRLIYVVCSLLDAEGADQVAGFLAAHPDWRADPPALPLGTPRGTGTRLTPFHDGTDGFFIARLEKAC